MLASHMIAATSFFNGRVYSVVHRQTDCGDATRARLKRYVGSRAGVSL